MHGITGGDDDYLVREARPTVRNALKRGSLRKGDGQNRELKKAVQETRCFRFCGSARSSAPWSS